MRLILLLLLITGCTVCDSPYGVIEGSCCLDKDDNGVCDDLNVEPTEIIVKEEIIVDNTELYSEIITDTSIQSLEYIPEDLFTFFVTPGNELKSVSLKFLADCKSADLQIGINEKLVYVGPVECAKMQTIDMDIDAVKEAINEISFASKKIFPIDNASIYLRYDDDLSKQNFDRFTIESDEKKRNLVKSLDVMLQNYQDINFKIDDIKIDHTLVFTNSGTDVTIYLNSEPIYQGSDVGSFKIKLPIEHKKVGKNRIRFSLISE